VVLSWKNPGTINDWPRLESAQRSKHKTAIGPEPWGETRAERATAGDWARPSGSTADWTWRAEANSPGRRQGIAICTLLSMIRSSYHACLSADCADDADGDRLIRPIRGVQAIVMPEAGSPRHAVFQQNVPRDDQRFEPTPLTVFQEFLE